MQTGTKDLPLGAQVFSPACKNNILTVWDTLVVRAGAFIIAAIAFAKLREAVEEQKSLRKERGKSFWYL